MGQTSRQLVGIWNKKGQSRNRDPDNQLRDCDDHFMLFNSLCSFTDCSAVTGTCLKLLSAGMGTLREKWQGIGSVCFNGPHHIITLTCTETSHPYVVVVSFGPNSQVPQGVISSDVLKTKEMWVYDTEQEFLCDTHTHTCFLVQTVSIQLETRSGQLFLSYNITHCNNLRLQPDHILSEAPGSHCAPANGSRSWDERQ